MISTEISLVPWGVPERKSCLERTCRETDGGLHAGRLLLPANTSWFQAGCAGGLVVQLEPLKGLAVFVGRAVHVCTPLNALQFSALITLLDALITT